jgi:protease PrsW
MNVQLAMLGALPALGAMYFVDRLDAKRPEPRAALRRIAMLGGLAVIPCIIVELVLAKLFHHFAPLPGALFKAYITAGTVEEVAKAVCLFFFVWRRPELDERFDGIVYATRAALGFALVENIGYLVGARSFEGFTVTFVTRAVLTVPAHAIFAGMMGYFAARRRFDGSGIGWPGGLAIAIFLHGTFDAAIFASPLVAPALRPLLAIVPVLIVILGFLALRELSRRAIAADEGTLRDAAQRV